MALWAVSDMGRIGVFPSVAPWRCNNDINVQFPILGLFESKLRAFWGNSEAAAQEC